MIFNSLYNTALVAMLASLAAPATFNDTTLDLPITVSNAGVIQTKVYVGDLKKPQDLRVDTGFWRTWIFSEDMCLKMKELDDAGSCPNEGLFPKEQQQQGADI